MRLNRLLLVSSALSAFIPVTAQAQDADATTAAATEETIVVTGSRIARPNLENSTPTAVLG